jgi:hypothetical protein
LEVIDGIWNGLERKIACDIFNSREGNRTAEEVEEDSKDTYLGKGEESVTVTRILYEGGIS